VGHAEGANHMTDLKRLMMDSLYISLLKGTLSERTSRLHHVDIVSQQVRSVVLELPVARWTCHPHAPELMALSDFPVRLACQPRLPVLPVRA